MKRIFLQYMGMGASLLSMFWAIAYLRRATESTYLAQMAVFLILLAWSTPFEASFGNVLIGAARNNPAAAHQLIGGKFNRSMYLKAMLTGLGFAAAFFLYSQKNTDVGFATIIGIGALFFLRLVEYLLKIKLLFVNWGQQAQIICNFFTAAKWLVAAGFILAGIPSFTFFVLAHVSFGVISVSILSANFLARQNREAHEEIPDQFAARLKDDFVAIFGMGAGVFAFQIDKLVAVYFYTAERFGEYVSVYTLSFIGPYIINPIFVLALQKLSLAGVHGSTSGESGERLVYAMMRLAALAINVAIPVVVMLFLNALSKPLSAGSQTDVAAFVLASYLNCLCHIYYLMYLTRGDFKSILYQNLTAVAFGGGAAAILYTTHSNFLALVLIATAFGQFLFGAAKQVAMDIRPKFEVVFPGILLSLYLALYSLAYPMDHYYGAFALGGIAIFLIGLGLEMKALDLKWRDLPGTARALTA